MFYMRNNSEADEDVENGFVSADELEEARARLAADGVEAFCSRNNFPLHGFKLI